MLAELHRVQLPLLAEASINESLPAGQVVQTAAEMAPSPAREYVFFGHESHSIQSREVREASVSLGT